MRVRLGYRKLGRAAFSSHLDMVRLLPRLFRRLDLPLYYSLGYNSKPVMAFGPALSLGVASLAEYVDVKLVASDHVDFATLPARLSEASVSGVEFFAAVALGPDDPKLSALMHESSYVVGLPRAALAELGLHAEGELRARVEEQRRGALRTRRPVDGGLGKWVDVGKYLRSVDVGAGHEVLAQAGIAGDLVPLRIRLRMTHEGTAKVSEALDALLGKADVPSRIVREGLYFRAGESCGSPLDLTAARAVRQHAVEPAAVGDAAEA